MSTILDAINLQGTRIVYPILIGIGNLGTVINLFIFLQKEMRNRYINKYDFNIGKRDYSRWWDCNGERKTQRSLVKLL